MERFCIFDVGHARVALPMEYVRETINRVELTPMVLAPDFVHGLFALRGEILSVLNLASFIGGTAATGELEPSNTATTLLVIERGDARFAVPVQRISTAEVDTALLEPHPKSALYPALQARCNDAAGSFDILQFDRLEASVHQALGFESLFQVA